MDIDLRALRAQTDDVDKKIAEMFEARMSLFAQTAALHVKNGTVPDETAYEQYTIERLMQKCDGPIAAYIPLLFELIYDLGHDYQSLILDSD